MSVLSRSNFKQRYKEASIALQDVLSSEFSLTEAEKVMKLSRRILCNIQYSIDS